MLKFGVFTWIVLTVILLLFPLGFVLFFVFRDFMKYVYIIWNKILSTKTLNSMRKEILQQNIQDQEEFVREISLENKEFLDKSDVEA
jgi:hypothetical protein